MHLVQNDHIYGQFFEPLYTYLALNSRDKSKEKKKKQSISLYNMYCTVSVKFFPTYLADVNTFNGKINGINGKDRY